MLTITDVLTCRICQRSCDFPHFTIYAHFCRLTFFTQLGTLGSDRASTQVLIQRLLQCLDNIRPVWIRYGQPSQSDQKSCCWWRRGGRRRGRRRGEERGGRRRREKGQGKGHKEGQGKGGKVCSHSLSLFELFTDFLIEKYINISRVAAKEKVRVRKASILEGTAAQEAALAKSAEGLKILERLVMQNVFNDVLHGIKKS